MTIYSESQTDTETELNPFFVRYEWSHCTVKYVNLNKDSGSK